MTNRGIHQLNTVETVKVAQHNRMTLWNNDGVLTDKALKEFDDNVFDNSELFSYNYLYRQQEVPQHMVDVSNKAAIQIMKKCLIIFLIELNLMTLRVKYLVTMSLILEIVLKKLVLNLVLN